MQDLTVEQKQAIVKAMLERRSTFTGSDKMYAEWLDINASVYNQIKNGANNQNLLSKGKWISIARKLEVPLKGEMKWVTAVTETYSMIKSQMEFCATYSTSAVFCDEADTGKTYAMKDNVKRNRNWVYVDCSQYKSKHLLVRKIAAEFGLESGGRYNEVKNDLCYYLRTLDKPLVALDELGDLEYNAFLEIKALWNSTEGACGWYAAGADGLKVKLERGRNNKKVGYAEFYRRFGSRYQKATPAGKDDRQAFINRALTAIAMVNAPDKSVVQKIVTGAAGSLTRVKTEIMKFNNAA
jgi:DNA transposition AAA+ family ATPase